MNIQCNHIEALKAENLELRKELAAMTERYTSAVTLKPAAREAFGKLREAMEVLRVETRAVLEASPPEHRAAPASEPTLNLPVESFLADAERIVGEERVSSQFASLDWSEFSDDGKLHVAAVVRQAKAEAYAEVEAATGAVANKADLARLAASQWSAAQGYQGFDWNGLTGTQQHAWRAVVDFLRKPAHQPALDAGPLSNRVAIIRQAFARNTILDWHSEGKAAVGRVHDLQYRLDGSCKVIVAIVKRQGLTWVDTGDIETFEAHLLTSLSTT